VVHTNYNLSSELIALTTHLLVTKNTGAEWRLEPSISCYILVSNYTQWRHPRMEVKRKYITLSPGPHAIKLRDTVQSLQGNV